MTPYDVLQINADATIEQIRSAYVELAKMYHPDLHSGDRLEVAKQRMQEINVAYESILNERRGLNASAFKVSFQGAYADIQSMIDAGHLNEASLELERVETKDAYWHFLCGLIAFRSGDSIKACTEFQLAYELAPDDAHIALAYNMMGKVHTIEKRIGIRPKWIAIAMIVLGILSVVLYNLLRMM